MEADSAIRRSIVHTEAYCEFVRVRAHLIQLCIKDGDTIEEVAELLGMDPELVRRIATAPSPGSW